MNLLIRPHLAGLLLAVLPAAAAAATLDEAASGDFSDDRLAPTVWLLEGGSVGNNGETGHNVLTGRFGRSGVLDLDYVHLVIPAGYQWSELRVGQQTTTAGSAGSFLGVALGETMPVLPGATSPDGLYLWSHFGSADRGTDILPRLKLNGGRTGGFLDGAIGPGSYTLWLQELSPGSWPYRLNIVLSPVPVPPAGGLAAAGLLALATWRRRAR